MQEFKNSNNFRYDHGSGGGSGSGPGYGGGSSGSGFNGNLGGHNGKDMVLPTTQLLWVALVT